MRPLTEYGLEVNLTLMQQQKKQSWLIDALRNKYPDKYIDSSIMYKVLTGQITKSWVYEGISEILNIEPPTNANVTIEKE